MTSEIAVASSEQGAECIESTARTNRLEVTRDIENKASVCCDDGAYIHSEQLRTAPGQSDTSEITSCPPNTSPFEQLDTASVQPQLGSNPLKMIIPPSRPGHPDAGFLQTDAMDFAEDPYDETEMQSIIHSAEDPEDIILQEMPKVNETRAYTEDSMCPEHLTKSNCAEILHSVASAVIASPTSPSLFEAANSSVLLPPCKPADPGSSRSNEPREESVNDVAGNPTEPSGPSSPSGSPDLSGDLRGSCTQSAAASNGWFLCGEASSDSSDSLRTRLCQPVSELSDKNPLPNDSVSPRGTSHATSSAYLVTDGTISSNAGDKQCSVDLPDDAAQPDAQVANTKNSADLIDCLVAPYDVVTVPLSETFVAGDSSSTSSGTHVQTLSFDTRYASSAQIENRAISQSTESKSTAELAISSNISLDFSDSGKQSATISDTIIIASSNMLAERNEHHFLESPVVQVSSDQIIGAHIAPAGSPVPDFNDPVPTTMGDGIRSPIPSIYTAPHGSSPSSTYDGAMQGVEELFDENKPIVPCMSSPPYASPPPCDDALPSSPPGRRRYEGLLTVIGSRTSPPPTMEASSLDTGKFTLPDDYGSGSALAEAEVQREDGYSEFKVDYEPTPSSSPLPSSSPFPSSSLCRVFSSSPPPDITSSPPSSPPPVRLSTSQDVFPKQRISNFEGVSLISASSADNKRSRSIEEHTGDDEFHLQRPQMLKAFLDPKPQTQDSPRKRIKTDASPSPHKPPNPKRPTLAFQQRQRQKLATPFRSPLVDKAILQHGINSVYTSGKNVRNVPARPVVDPPIFHEAATFCAARTDGVDSANKDYTENAAKPFKPPLSASSGMPSSSSSQGVKSTPMIQALQRKAQILKQAIRIKSAGDGREEHHLEDLTKKWTNAGREVAWALWDTMKDLDPGDSLDRSKWNNGPCTDGPGWGFDDGRVRGRSGFEDSWGWGESHKPEDAGDSEGKTTTSGGDDDTVPHLQHSLGTMLRHLGIAPQTLGWDEDEGDFADQV